MQSKQRGRLRFISGSPRSTSKIDQFQFKQQTHRHPPKTRSSFFQVCFLGFLSNHNSKQRWDQTWAERIYHHLFNHVSPLSVHHPSIDDAVAFQFFAKLNQCTENKVGKKVVLLLLSMLTHIQKPHFRVCSSVHKFE